MGPVCSDELCAAVSEAGGLGMITVAVTPPEALEGRLAHIRSLTSSPEIRSYPQRFLPRRTKGGPITEGEVSYE